MSRNPEFNEHTNIKEEYDAIHDVCIKCEIKEEFKEEVKEEFEDYKFNTIDENIDFALTTASEGLTSKL